MKCSVPSMQDQEPKESPAIAWAIRRQPPAVQRMRRPLLLRAARRRRRRVMPLPSLRSLDPFEDRAERDICPEARRKRQPDRCGAAINDCVTTYLCNGLQPSPRKFSADRLHLELTGLVAGAQD